MFFWTFWSRQMQGAIILLRSIFPSTRSRSLGKEDLYYSSSCSTISWCSHHTDPELHSSEFLFICSSLLNFAMHLSSTLWMQKMRHDSLLPPCTRIWGRLCLVSSYCNLEMQFLLYPRFWMAQICKKSVKGDAWFQHIVIYFFVVLSLNTLEATSIVCNDVNE